METFLVIALVVLCFFLLLTLRVMATREAPSEPETTFAPDITEATRRKLWESIHNKEIL